MRLFFLLGYTGEYFLLILIKIIFVQAACQNILFVSVDFDMDLNAVERQRSIFSH